MACFHPLAGYQEVLPGVSGKRKVVFNRRPGHVFQDIRVACGQCRGCRETRAREWAARCYHEASLHEANCFITLTYDDENLPFAGSLVKSDFQKFMKRLRKEVICRCKEKDCDKFHGRIRYYHAGEYGSAGKRPHYHALLFGFDFPDKVYISDRDGYPVWRSGTLEKIWPVGFSEIGSLTFESAMYVARYIQKKWTGKDAIDHYLSVDEETGEVWERLPEYTTMSRRPGIGKEWFERFKSEVYPSDQVVVRGRVMPPPKYYDSQFEVLDAAELLEVKRRRRARVREEDCTPDRLRVREVVLGAKLAVGKRSFED